MDGDKLFDLVQSMRSGYDALSESKYVRSRSGLAPMGGGADYHIRNEILYLNLIEKARDLCMNASIVGKSIEKAGTNVVGDGFTLCPVTGDTGVNTMLFDKWIDWTSKADECDVAGERTWSEMEELAAISAIRDGDIIGLGTEDGGLQLIESHQCRNPRGGGRSKNVVVGVEMNELRKRVKYHIRSEVINPYKSIGSAPSSAYDVRDSQGVRVLFHYFVSERSSATRGVTALAPVSRFDGLWRAVFHAYGLAMAARRSAACRTPKGTDMHVS
jgi:capsid protein